MGERVEQKKRLARQKADEFLMRAGYSLRDRSHATIPDRNHMDNSEAPYHPCPF